MVYYPPDGDNNKRLVVETTNNARDKMYSPDSNTIQLPLLLPGL